MDPLSKLLLSYSGFTFFFAFCIFGHLSTAFSLWLCLLWVNNWMCHLWLRGRKVRSPEVAARVAIILLLNLELFQGIESPLRASSVWKAMELCQEVTTRRNEVKYKATSSMKYNYPSCSVMKGGIPAFAALRNLVLLRAVCLLELLVCYNTCSCL